MDLAHTCVYISLKIIAEDATLVGSTINYIGATIFDKIDILLNDTQISSSNGNSAYRAMLETLLTYDKQALESQLQAGGFYKDTGGIMDIFTADGGNEGFKERYELTKGGNTVDYIARIHADIFNQPKLLVNGVKV